MHLSARIGMLLGALSLPLLAMAAPASVENIRATLEDTGSVTVRWNAVNDPTVVRYRVFYSFASILENEGLYDDFEETDGAATSHTIIAPPAVDTLYVSVLAVNAGGEESAYFTNEASVDLRQSPARDGILRLLKAESLSATGILLTFSHPLVAPPGDAGSLFAVRDAGGIPLRLTRLVIRGNEAELFSDPRQDGVYRISLGDGLRGIGADGAQLSLDPNQAPVLFQGNGTAPATGDGEGGADVSGLTLAAERMADGSTTVAVSWQHAMDDRVRGYRIAQSTDGGRTYRADTSVRREINGIRITNAAQGSLTVRVQALLADGSATPGAAQTVPVTSSTQPSGPLGGSVAATGGALTDSGSTMTLLAVISAGIATGFLMMRRKLSLA